jgi:hypothetical protein
MAISAPKRPLSWLGKPLAYTLGSPLMMIAGSATTIAAPILLTPAQFASLSLLATVFMYAADFDIGLSKLADRELSSYSPRHSLPEFVVARFVICVLLCLITALAGLYLGGLFAIAGIAGACFMLTNGPFSYYRARSQIYDFTLVGLVISIGMSLPRFVGLLAGGVEGTMLALLVWYSATSVFVNKPFWTMLAANKQLYRCRILLDALPLFAFNYLWFVYLLSNRWFVWSISGADDTGLFAFGATLLYIGIGLMASIGQIYYPKYLTSTSSDKLTNELLWVLAVVTVGITVGTVFCRYGLPMLFPRFAAASLSSSIILLSGLPLCLAAWITPLIIARSNHPWRESGIIFGSSLLLLYVSIYAAASYGILGQSLACLPSAMLLLFSEMVLLHKIGLVRKPDIVTLAVALAICLLVCGTVNYAVF